MGYGISGLHKNRVFWLAWLGGTALLEDWRGIFLLGSNKFISAGGCWREWDTGSVGGIKIEFYRRKYFCGAQPNLFHWEDEGKSG